MSQHFNKCLQKGKIKKFSRGRALFKKEIKLARQDIETAEKSFQQRNFKWSIIQAYYSMFHSARALLYKQNYREKNHFCLIVTIPI